MIEGLCKLIFVYFVALLLSPWMTWDDPFRLFFCLLIIGGLIWKLSCETDEYDEFSEEYDEY